MAKNMNDLSTQRLYDLLMPSAEAPEMLPYDAPAEEEADVSISNEKLEALRQRMTTAASSALAEPGEGIVLVNLTEALVADRLDAAFDKFNCCKCDRCRKRAAAFALNDLAPNYVAARVDQIEELLSGCSTKNAAAALVRAVLRVKSSPEH